MNKVILKPGREKSLLQGHPWIFSGSIQNLPPCRPGEIFPIYSATDTFLGQGYFNPEISLTGRVLTFSDKEITSVLKEHILNAKLLRDQLFNPNYTNAYRLINAEGDKIPGLIVDVYGEYLVVQVHTQGIDRLKATIVEILIEIFHPKGIFEKSVSSSRDIEKLEPIEGIVYGLIPEKITILENGIQFLVSIPNGQKTGFFLDQREMRKKVGELAKGKSVLNCFSYSGGFSIYALKNGAAEATSVDSCKHACALANENGTLNLLLNHQVVQQDVFEYLNKAPLNSNFVILDPPAFAKKQSHLKNALNAYQKLNEIVLKKLPSNSYLLTCSCSYFVDEMAFQKAIFVAANNAKRSVRILSRHLQAFDHPIDLKHREGAYLKSLLLFVE